MVHKCRHGLIHRVLAFLLLAVLVSSQMVPAPRVHAADDITSPTVINVTSSTPDGYSTVNSVIPITFVFSEPVYVMAPGDLPLITLAIGATTRNMAYYSGSGTTNLNFGSYSGFPGYAVDAGDNSPDLDYVSANALALNGGTIKDIAGNNAVLTLPAPGTPGSLGYNNNLVIDTTSPIE